MGQRLSCVFLRPHSPSASEGAMSTISDWTAGWRGRRKVSKLIQLFWQQLMCKSGFELKSVPFALVYSCSLQCVMLIIHVEKMHHVHVLLNSVSRKNDHVINDHLLYIPLVDSSFLFCPPNYISWIRYTPIFESCKMLQVERDYRNEFPNVWDRYPKHVSCFGNSTCVWKAGNPWEQHIRNHTNLAHPELREGSNGLPTALSSDPQRNKKQGWPQDLIKIHLHLPVLGFFSSLPHGGLLLTPAIPEGLSTFSSTL